MRRNEYKEEKRRKYEEMKEKLKTPMDPLPQRELCA